MHKSIEEKNVDHHNAIKTSKNVKTVSKEQFKLFDFHNHFFMWQTQFQIDKIISQFQMGNQNLNSIPSNFRENCHPKLIGASVNKQQESLELHILNKEEYLQWKWNLYPLNAYHKYLMLPIYFYDQNLGLVGCQPQSSNNIIVFNVRVGYEPFIYTLRKQILSRKLNNSQFSEKQFWKILKATTIALKHWTHAYEQFQIGQICPENILFNANGYIKIVHLFSFPPDSIINVNGKSYSYFEINPMNKLTCNKISQEQKKQHISNSLKQIGFTLLNMLSLNEEIIIDRANSIRNLQNQNRVSSRIKSIILWLLQSKLRSPEQLDSLIETAINHKNQ